MDGFRILRQKYNIPSIRFQGGAYGQPDWKLHTDNPREYFRRFDLLVKAAEKEGFGLIPSLFWYVCTMPNLAVLAWRSHDAPPGSCPPRDGCARFRRL